MGGWASQFGRQTGPARCCGWGNGCFVYECLAEIDDCDDDDDTDGDDGVDDDGDGGGDGDDSDDDCDDGDGGDDDDDGDGGDVDDPTKVSHLSVMLNFAHHDFYMNNINNMHLVVKNIRKIIMASSSSPLTLTLTTCTW